MNHLKVGYMTKMWKGHVWHLQLSSVSWDTWWRIGAPYPSKRRHLHLGFSDQKTLISRSRASTPCQVPTHDYHAVMVHDDSFHLFEPDGGHANNLIAATQDTQTEEHQAIKTNFKQADLARHRMVTGWVPGWEKNFIIQPSITCEEHFGHQTTYWWHWLFPPTR